MDSTPADCDIAIVGLGPVGVVLAMLLAKAGHRVVGVDAAPDIFESPRAIGLDHESLRVLQNLGLAEQLTSVIDAYRPSEYHAADGTVLRRLLPAPEPFPLSWPSYVTFVQPALERLLRERAGQCPGLKLRLSTEATAIADRLGVPILSVKNVVTQREERLRCKFIVGCDGGNSFVRKAISAKLEDLGFDEPWLVLDILLGQRVSLPETNIQFCDPARPCTYVRGPGSLRRWEFMLLPGERPEDLTKPDKIWELLRPWLEPSQAKIWRAATYRFHALVTESWRSGRVFLAGDAAHQTPPFLAQGLNQGIRDIANLAWKLSAVLQGAADRVLDSYQAERRPNVREVISITKALGREICERDPAAAAARDERLRSDFERGNGVRIRQDLLPRLRNALTDEDQNREPLPGEGQPLPQPWVTARRGVYRLDDLIGVGFRLVLGEDFQAEASEERARALGFTVARLGAEGQGDASGLSFVDEKRLLTNWMKKHGCKGAIVRPDHIVYAAISTEFQLDQALSRIALALRPA